MLSGEQKRIEIDRQDEARLLGVKNVKYDYHALVTLPLLISFSLVMTKQPK